MEIIIIIVLIIVGITITIGTLRRALRLDTLVKNHEIMIQSLRQIDLSTRDNSSFNEDM